jgi:hypothetical protein
MITRQPSRPGRFPAGWALALLAALLATLLPLAAGDAGASEALPDRAPPEAAANAPPALLGAAPALLSVARQQTDDQATLETRRPEVQWGAGDSGPWQAVPARQSVRAGDRVRTGSGASARLVYFEGTTIDLGPDTGIRIERLARTDGGNVVTRLFQSAGSTVSRVVRLVDPAASFEVETPAATAFVRGTTPRVEVAPDGSTRVTNVPDGTEGLVVVIGKDQNTTRVTLRPGQRTSVQPGLPPSLPGLAPGLSGEQELGQPQQLEQQERHRQEQERARQAAEQARLGLIAAQAELARLTAQENALLRQIAELLTPTPTPTPKGVGPSNDAFAGATTVQALPARFQQDTSGATTEGSEPIAACVPTDFIGKTIWFKLVAPASGGVSVDTFGSTFDTVLMVYSGTSLGNLTLVACNDDTLQPGGGNTTQSRVVFGTTPGTTYYVQAGGVVGTSGNLVVNFHAAPPPPANDNFARALVVGNPLSTTFSAVTESASTEPGEPIRPICGGRPRTIGGTVWYTFTPTTTAAVAVDTRGSSIDTLLAVYSGTTLNNLALVRCNDDVLGTLQSRVSFLAQAGTTYYVQVGGFIGTFGNLTVNFGAGLPPPANDNFASATAIATLPAQLTATTDSAGTEAGEPVSFTCAGQLVAVDGTVWYTFTPTTTGFVALDTFLTDYDTVLAVYTGGALGALGQVACNDSTLQSGTGNSDQSRVVFNAVAGTTYRIQVGGFRGAFGNLVLRAATTSPPPPNDNFATATVIAPASLPATATAITDSASVEVGEPGTPGASTLLCAGFNVTTTNTVWYRFTPATSGALVVDTFGSSYDTVAAVYTGGAVNALSQVACSNNAAQPGTASTPQSRVVALVTAGTTYHVQIGGVQGAFGTLAARFTFGPPPPANDAFANAQAVSALPTSFGPIDTTTTGTESGEPTTVFLCNGRPIGNTLWYTFTPAATLPVSIDTFGSSFDTVLAVYANNTGTPAASLLSNINDPANRVACNDDAQGVQSQVTFLATAGTTYYVQAGGFNGAFGTLQVRFQQAAPPANDDFANATAAAPGQLTVSTVAATTQAGEPLVVDASCDPTLGGQMGATVWYTYTSPIPTQVTVDTFGSSFDTVVSVYTGAAVNSLARAACNDDAQGTQSRVSFAAAPSTTYRVQVGGFNGAVGSLVVNFGQSPDPGLPRVQAAPSPVKPLPPPPADKPNAPTKQRPAPARGP